MTMHVRQTVLIPCRLYIIFIAGSFLPATLAFRLAEQRRAETAEPCTFSKLGRGLVLAVPACCQRLGPLPCTPLLCVACSTRAPPHAHLTGHCACAHTGACKCLVPGRAVEHAACEWGDHWAWWRLGGRERGGAWWQPASQCTMFT